MNLDINHKRLVEKGQWYRMPTGKLAEVCSTQDCEVTVRYLNADGAMSPSDFQLSLDFLRTRTEQVRVAPHVAV